MPFDSLSTIHGALCEGIRSAEIPAVQTTWNVEFVFYFGGFGIWNWEFCHVGKDLEWDWNIGNFQWMFNPIPEYEVDYALW